MDIIISFLAEAMFWGTVPLIVVLGLWEHHLTVSDTEHTLIQIGLLVVVYGWAWLWLWIGENYRLAHMIEDRNGRKRSNCSEDIWSK